MSQILIKTHMAQLLDALTPAMESEDIATMQAALQAQAPAIRFIADCCRSLDMHKRLMEGTGETFKAESERDVPDPLERGFAYFAMMLDRVSEAPTQAHAFAATLIFMTLVDECLQQVKEQQA